MRQRGLGTGCRARMAGNPMTLSTCFVTASALTPCIQGPRCRPPSEVTDRSGFLEHLRHARDFLFLQQPTDLLRRCLMLG